MSDLPGPSEALSPRSEALWAAVVADFDLDPTQLALLEEALRSLDRAEQARRIVDVEGVTYHDRFLQPRPHPALVVERDQRGLFARLLRELGLDSNVLEAARPPLVRGRYDD